MKAEEVKLAEDILLKNIGKAFNNKSVFHQRYLDAMHEYSERKIDELIEKIVDESHKTNGISPDKVIFIKETVAGFNITEINFKDWLQSLKSK